MTQLARPGSEPEPRCSIRSRKGCKHRAAKTGVGHESTVSEACALAIASFASTAAATTTTTTTTTTTAAAAAAAACVASAIECKKSAATRTWPQCRRCE